MGGRPMAGGGVQALGRAVDDGGVAACVGDVLMMAGGG
jgi:hypothetical protein